MKLLYNGQALIVGLEDVNLAAFPRLKVIGCNMTSVEHLPLKECEGRGIKVISLKGERQFLDEITSTAEHTMGLIIALMRNYKRAFANPGVDREELKGNTLNGKTLGIIGYGRIGTQLTSMAEAFGMNVVWVDRREDGTMFSGYGEGFIEVIKLLKQSDIVTLHIPLEHNVGFFTESLFNQMKPTAYFINTSRSKIVEDGALIKALKSGTIQGAAIDFTDDKDLLDIRSFLPADVANKLILTNHLGGCTVEDMAKTEEFITNKVKEYIEQNGT